MGIHQDQILHQRYRIGKLLGRGQAKTFRGTRLADDVPVIIKELKFSEIDNWKAYDLFQREINTLKGLKHHAFPELYDHFEKKEGEDTWMYLILECIPGKNLQEAMDAGWRPGQQEVRALAIQALDALQYLQQLAPPLIHRDIKPSNLIWHEQRLSLIDFGAVQDMMRPEGSSTIVGTFGYMAPEQFSGRAVPASDLYALGATLVHLLSGRSPSEIPQRELRLDFRDYVTCAEPLCQWLERMLEPMTEYRFQRAEEAKAALLNEQVQPVTPATPPRSAQRATGQTTGPLEPMFKPMGSKVELERTGDHLRIAIPPGLFTASSIFMLGFNAFWLTFITIWTTFALQGSILFALFSIPFWAVGLGMLAFNVNNIFTHTELHFSPQHIQVKKNYGKLFQKEQNYPLNQLVAVQRNLSFKSNNTPHFNLQIEVGTKKVGTGTNLTRQEQDWLKNEILRYAQQQLPQPLSQRILQLSDSSEH